jgi:hypothetical protein
MCALTKAGEISLDFNGGNTANYVNTGLGHKSGLA